VSQLLRPPVVGVCRNPMLGLRPDQMQAAKIGATLAQLAPEPTGLLVCRYNGEYLLPEDWERCVVSVNDVVEFYDFPQDRDSLRMVLQVAVATAAFYFSGGNPYVFAAINIGGNLAINALLPVLPQQVAGSNGFGTTYSTSLDGNQARLDEPIWRTCGRYKITPAFAGQPYLEYIDNDGDNLDNDQYFYVVYIVGIDDYDVETALLGQTKISHFQDVLKAEYLAPGVQPSMAKANVTTSKEVSSQVLDELVYVGGYSACAPGRKVAQLGIDVAATRGLGNGGNLTVRWSVQVREIDDFGSGQTDWIEIAVEERTANTNTPQRWSNKYTITTPARLEVRLARLDIKNTDANALHELAWVGMRAYLSDAASLNANSAHFEVVMRASEQLTNESSHQVALILQAKVQTWTPDDGWSLTKTYTRNAAWWLLDLARSPVWGLGLPDERIDIQSFYDLALVWDARQDRFDYCFDTTMDAWEAMQLIARTGRARVFRRHGILTIARDEQADLPMSAFTPSNTQPGSMTIQETLPVENTPDGFIVEYFSNRTWQWTPIECPAPGVSEMTKPVLLRLPGITGTTHAHREGLFEAASLAYRTRTATCTTEMQGLLPAYMSPVRFMLALGYGQSGEVVDWNLATLTLRLSEPPVFGASNYLTLQRDDGSLTTPVAVLPGTDQYSVILPSAPDFTLVLDDAERERPMFLFGAQGQSDELCKISAISDGGRTDEGAQLYELAMVIDDDRVHAADNALLPGPGDVQDPIISVETGGDGTGGGGTAVGVRLNYHDLSNIGFAKSIAFTLHTDGTFTWDGTGYHNTPIEGAGPFDPPYTSNGGSYPGEWLTAVSDPVVAAQYEVFVHWETSGLVPPTGDAVETWLPMTSDRRFELDLSSFPGANDGGFAIVYIRKIGTTIIQATAGLIINVIYDNGSGGGL